MKIFVVAVSFLIITWASYSSDLPPPPTCPFLKGEGEVSFNYLPQRGGGGDSEKLEKGVEIWFKGRSS